ncbi:hypothetical protein C7B61_10740 [filamentous cyanobacterium CCP1]|nr:hypothetical protein C7B76_14325 [filamentous cyanobacterium CCP2]PSB65969.1 hypothetical protein C7B61_10740 [filamentous cyanobacterium CCP1]
MMASIHPSIATETATVNVMKVIYDTATDVLRIVFRDVPVEDFSEDRPDVTVEYDADDTVIAMKIKNASKIVDDPRSLEFKIL